MAEKGEFQLIRSLRPSLTVLGNHRFVPMWGGDREGTVPSLAPGAANAWTAAPSLPDWLFGQKSTRIFKSTLAGRHTKGTLSPSWNKVRRGLK